MHTHVKTTDSTLSAIDARSLERRPARIQRMVPRLDPDLVHLNLVIERDPRKTEFRCSLRLTLDGRVLATTRQRAPAVRTLITESFDRIEAQLNRAREMRIDRRTRRPEGDVESVVTG